MNTGDETKANKGGSFYGDYALEQLWENVNSAIAQVCDNTTFAELIELERSKKTTTVPNYSI
jgi:DNA-binding IscR family transcriptional regulator